MVDLVKIRKKAKKQVTGDRSQVTDTAPESVTVPQEAPPPEPAAEPPEPQDSGLRTQDSPQSSVLSPQSSEKLERFKETAGTRREGFIDEEAETSSEIQLELLTFVLAGEQYAIEIENIVEIVTPRAVTRIPNADGGIVGIISLRGTIVTVLDVRQRLQHPPANGAHPDRRIIVVEKDGETLGFEVDRVLRVVKTEPGAVEPHPVVHASELHEAIRGVFRHGTALTILLDFDKLLS